MASVGLVFKGRSWWWVENKGLGRQVGLGQKITLPDVQWAGPVLSTLSSRQGKGSLGLSHP